MTTHHDMLWTIALGMTLAGCLTTPPAASDAGGDATGIAADAGPDAMPNPCGSVAQYTPQVWPPSTPVGVRDVVATDINGDGNVDIVVTNGAVGDPDYLGFWVLLGPQTDPGALVFHAFAASAAYPRSVAVHDALGSPCADVTTFGENTGNNAGFIEVFENVGPPDMFAALPVLKSIAFTPFGDAVPVHVLYAALDPDSVVDDVVVADLSEMYVLYTSGGDFASQLATSTPVRVGSDGTDLTNWNNINAIFARPSPASTAIDDLLVVEVTAMTWLFDNGARGFGDTMPYRLENEFAFNAFGVVEVDYDQTGPLDVIGGGSQNFGAYAIDSDPQIGAEVLAWANSVPSDDGSIDDVAAGNLGGQDQIEVLLLDGNETDGSHLFLVDGTFKSGTTIMPATFDDYDFAGTIDPFQMVIADFNGDGSPEVWVFDRSGNANCLERNPAAPELRLCQ